MTGSTGTGTAINGDVGSAPTGTITNFPPSSSVPPFIVHNTGVQPDGVVQQARTDAIAAYNFLASQGPGTVLPDNLATVGALTSGIYSFTSGAPDLPASTTLTLNGPGIFVFNVGSSLTANVLSSVVGTANPCNVYWRVGTSATLNGNNFFGTVIADASITLGAGASLTGRALAGTGATGAVTMAGSGGNTIGGCGAASLGLQKTVVNTGGGTATAGQFTLTATGPTVISGTTPVAPVNAPLGVYTLTETGPAGYTASFSCSGGGTLVGNQLTIGAADGGATITCTIVNTFNVPRLGLQKTVVNTGGGTATPGQFTLTATGPAVISGPAPVAAANAPVGVYTLTETGPAGYTAGTFSCIGGGVLVGNQLTIGLADAGNTITCTIVNTFIAPGSVASLGLQKTVVNTGGGTATPGQFTLTATGPAVISGPAPVAAANAPVGVYTLTETGPAGYSAGTFSCSGGGVLVGNQLTIGVADAGNTITCSIVNTFIPVAAGVPTLSEWAMIMLAGLLVFTGFAAVRRQAR